jgi:hypothetical protein
MLAKYIFDKLHAAGFDVFMDVHSLGAGEFEKTTLAEIAARDYFLLVLTSGSLKGMTREKDWLRRELMQAVESGRTVIPVLAEEFKFEDHRVQEVLNNVPQALQALPSFNAVRIPPPEYFDSGMKRLISFLKTTADSAPSHGTDKSGGTAATPKSVVRARSALLGLTLPPVTSLAKSQSDTPWSDLEDRVKAITPEEERKGSSLWARLVAPPRLQAPTEWSDFEVEITGEGGSYRAAARSAAGDAGPVSVRLPFGELGLSQQLRALELAVLRSGAVRRLAPADERLGQQFGRRLFEFLFPPELRALLLASNQQAAQQATLLRVRLRIGPPELAALPWEFLYDPGEDDYLCLRTPLVRYLSVPRPQRPLTVTPPLRILAVIAHPDGLDSLNVDLERRRLTEALAGLEAAGQVQLSWVQGQTWWDLQNALDRDGWHIFQFIGHGELDTQTGEGVVALAAEDGRVHRLGATDLARLLAEQASLRLVVLDSCETGQASATGWFSSTASVLIRRGIPAVAAMQYEISDPAAMAFARGFYTAIANQHPVEQAVTRARWAIKLARQNTLEWVTPVLFLSSATGALFDLPDIPPPPAATPAAQAPVEPDTAKTEQPDPTRVSTTGPEPNRPEPAIAGGNGLTDRGEPVGGEAGYRRAADAGNSEAMFNLGALLEQQGDPAGAETWYRKAADAGNSWAMYTMGALLELQGDLAGAETWYRKAADADDRSSMFELGALLEGRRDWAGAETWYRKAADAGIRNAKRKLRLLRVRKFFS